MRVRVALLGLLLVTGFSAAQPRSSELAALIRAQIESVLPEAHSSTKSTSTPAAEERSTLRGLYAAGEYAPLWLDAAGRPGPDVRVAIQLLTSAGEDGLDPAGYDPIALERVARDLVARPSLPARELARFDVGLSAAILRYLRHLHTGRVDPRRLGFRISVLPDARDFAEALRAAVAGHRVVDLAAELQPATDQYRGLRVMLGRYRTLAADTTLGISVPPATLRPGDVYGDVARLNRLLVAFGDLPPDSHTTAGLPAARAGGGPPTIDTSYAGPLVDGVREFQRRHGLDADGVIGPRTVAALRVPLSWRVRQIELALERQRWLPHPSDGRRILINIPMFRLWAWEPNSPAPSMSMGVIVGRALRTETPIFAHEMRDVIFRPYWNIPRSILRDELLPLIVSDPEYLARQDMEIVDGPGDDAPFVEPTVDHFDQLGQGRFRLRQRPGAQNALGLVKFVFPNEEQVYLHDTPAPRLFARSRRDFSHGCVRVEAALDLAAWALADHPDWTRERIEEAVAEEAPTRSVRLAQPIRVVLLYATAAVSPDDGTLHFADDIYRHDEPLDRAIRAHR